METTKPIPPVEPWTAPFWEGTRAGRLLVQHCEACERNIFYPRLYCPYCLSDRLGWIESSGRGTIYTFSVVENNAPSAFVADMPYVIAIVRLEEGVQMMTNIAGCDPRQLRCDLPVKVVFEPLDERITLPKFTPA